MCVVGAQRGLGVERSPLPVPLCLNAAALAAALLISFGAAGIIYNGFVLKQLTQCFSNQRILAMGAANGRGRPHAISPPPPPPRRAGLFAGFLDKLVYVFVVRVACPRSRPDS